MLRTMQTTQGAVALRERRRLHKANSVAISRRAMFCARRAKLGQPQPEFRAVRWQSGGGIGGAGGGYVRSGRLHWPAKSGYKEDNAR